MRYFTLNAQLFGSEHLRDYWEAAHPREWLFPGERPGEPITRFSVERQERATLAREIIAERRQEQDQARERERSRDRDHGMER